MGAEHKGIRRRRIREESAPSHAGHFGIEVSPRRPVRMAALDRVVQDITDDQAAVADTASTNRLDLRQRPAPFTRCVRCNGRLVAVTKDEVIDHLEPLTRRYCDDFSRCAECGRIYWPGSHRARLLSFVEGLRNQF